MKILVTDADGTIVFGDHKISNLDKKALLKFKQEDPSNLLIMATGRNLNPTKLILDTSDFYDVYDYFFLSNGAVMFDKEYNVININTLGNEVESICNIFEQSYRIDTKDDHYFTHEYYNCIDFTLDNPLLINDYQDVKDEIVVVSSRCNTQEEIDSLSEEISKLGNFELIQNKLDLDVQAKGMDKSYAIKKFIELKELKDYQLFTIGDSFNDVNMLKLTPTSATFNSSPDEIKEAAGYVVNSVGEYINKYII
ncbi:MAG: HAD hydrolase family protein [Mycoplasmatales bacterium]